MLSMLLSTICVCFILQYLYYYLSILVRARKHISSLPGWFHVPFIGNAHKLIRSTDVLFNRMEELTAIMNNNNGRTRLWLGPQLMILSALPEDIKAVNNTFTERPYYFHFARPWLGYGLITAPSNVWKRSVKMLGVTFTNSFVEGFYPVFNTQADKLVDKLKTEIGKPAFDMQHKYLARMTLETICQTALGVSDLSESIVTNEYFVAFQEAIDLVVARSLNVFHHSDFIYHCTSNYRRFTRNVKILHGLSKMVIEKKRKELDNNQNVDHPIRSHSRFKAFIDILLEVNDADEALSNEQIRAEVDTIIASGQETTALGLSFVFLILAKYPEVQQKVYEEVMNILGPEDKPLTREDLSKMIYLDAVLNEILRLYPPVLFAMRDISTDFQLDGFKIPKGTIFTLPLWSIGRCVHTFGPDAEQFKPERWLDHSANKPLASSPFGYGKRPCIGKRYAQALMKIVIIRCIKELEFVSDGQELVMKADLTLRPKAGHLVQVKIR